MRVVGTARGGGSNSGNNRQQVMPGGDLLDFVGGGQTATARDCEHPRATGGEGREVHKMGSGRTTTERRAYKNWSK